MAHVGRYWPLAFRRDLSLNVRTNNEGWAKAYLARFQTLTGTVGENLFGKAFEIETIFEASTGTMKSRSADQVIGGIRVYVEVELKIVGDPQRYEGTISIIRNNGTVLYKQGITKPELAQFVSFNAMLNTSISVETAGICEHSPFVNPQQLGIGIKPW